MSRYLHFIATYSQWSLNTIDNITHQAWVGSDINHQYQVETDLHTRTKLDTQRLSGPKHRVTDRYTRGFFVNLNCSLVGFDTNNLW